MAILQDLARIERVEDLRKVWEHEAADFTPWLAKNISLLGEALGIEDLEFREQEASVGPYSLDILAHDVRDDLPVVIENQLGITDHTHLGQLLTYASGFDANVMVWIAKKFKDEHREALDLLNHRTGEDTQFFGVELELWKIGNSPPAVNFKLVATPNEWSKRTKRKSDDVSRREDQYRQFYQPLIDALREMKFTHMTKAGTRAYCNFSTGQSGFRYAPYLSVSNRNNARVELYLGNGDREKNKSCFDFLASDKEGIESGIGELNWERLDDKIASRISVVRKGGLDDDDETLEVIREWMIERLLKFREVFGPRLAELVD